MEGGHTTLLELTLQLKGNWLYFALHARNLARIFRQSASRSLYLSSEFSDFLSDFLFAKLTLSEQMEIHVVCGN
jgi:hypothetical protein